MSINQRVMNIVIPELTGYEIKKITVYETIIYM